MTTMQLRTCTLLIALFFLLPFCTWAQRPAGNYYDTKWKTIDSLIERGQLTESALTQINAVYEHAKQEKNDPQLIKALVYRLRVQANKQEDAEKKAIATLETELTSAKQPASSILSSLLASAYWNYFQQHRYQLYDRTATAVAAKDDIATWSTTDLYKRIGDLYKSSIKEEQLLQQTRLESFNPIIEKGTARNLRPTLFDLLTHQALSFFKTSEIDLNRPAYAFEIDDPVAFADAAAFAKHSFVTKDSLSLHFTSLKLFQRLIRFHLNDTDPAALIDVDIERLGFVNSYAVMAEKQDAYRQALEHITNQYGDAPPAAQAWYLQAQLLTQKAQQYDPIKDTTNRYAKVKAKAICEKVIAQKDSSEGKANCQALLQSILTPALSLSTEHVNLPDQPFRTLVTWKNFTKLYIHIVAAGRQTRDKLGNNIYQDNWWTSLLSLPIIKNTNQDLPATGDYQQHRTEIKVDALPLGDYAMIASADPNFSLTRGPLVVQFFHVSAISYINRKEDFFVLDRSTGKPLPNADVQLYNQQYDYKKSMNEYIRGKAYKTDARGHFLHAKPSSESNAAERIEITYGKDKLMLDDQPQLYSYEPSQAGAPVPLPVDYTFTDRSIYRPGQTVYFKGIVIISNTKTKASTIAIGYNTKIGLYDANNTMIDSIAVTTNEYGSYKGQFRLPEGLLNGEFTIRDLSTKQQTSVRVEEYKRPKFYVEYDPLQGSYRIGDSIRVHGTAKAYAGNNIDGAVVSYRVVRRARFPWWYSWRFAPSSSEQEIAHGTTKTDANGKFNIGFIAIPDRLVSKNSDPVFEYTVSADIADINGESRSGETLVSVGYKSLELSFPSLLHDKLPADSLQSIRITAANLAGEAVPTLVNLKIYPLQMPARLIRDRYWPEPDQFVMTKEEYLRSFPVDAYASELQKESWPREASVFEASDSAGKKIPVTNNGKKWSPGVYVIEVHAKDKYGQDVKELKYITLYDAATGLAGYPQYSWITDETVTAGPGDKPAINIGSSARDLTIIRNSNDANFDYLNLSNEIKRTNVPITDSDRGGVQVADVFVKDNRVWFITHHINVPFTNKELTVNYKTFRDKTLPGSQEKWELTISGKKTDKVAAEVLTTMYDASLDQFAPHYWTVPEIYSGKYFTAWTTSAGFDDIQSQAHSYYLSYPPSFPKQYDQLLTFGFTTRMYIRGGRPGAVPAPSMMARDRVAAGEDVTFAISGKVAGLSVQKEARDYTAKSDTVAYRIDQAPAPDQSPVQVRKNFNETAFFFPDLKTDEQGNLTLSFTMPEALTKWKMMLLAHTKDLAFGYSEKEVVTQKQLMVQPNPPRFLREGDRMELGVKVVNLTDSEMTGQMELELTDPTTGQTADGRFTNRQPNQYFTVGAGQSAVVSFPLDIPYQYSAPLTYRVTARAKNYSDAEESILPVVSNRMLVTETLPLNMKGDGTKNFKFDKLLQSGGSETLNHHAVTVEFTANPAWYAVQALPYLMEYPYECAEQTFNRFYANALASKIANSSPRIQEIFDRWKNLDSAALRSNLEKNQELKSVLLQETPWVLQGKGESQQKRNIALLFDLNRMSTQLTATIDKLARMQAPNGGFVWFKGGPDDRYITQYILSGIAHLRQLKAIPASAKSKIDAIVASALPYLDQKIKEDYTRILKSAGKSKTTAHYIGYLPVQYLYMRSLLTEPGIPGSVFPAVNYFRKEAQASWQQYGRFTQAMIALALYRTGDVQTGKNIMAAIRENAIRDPEKGIYWKGMEGGYYWYEAPVETEALLIEAFHTIAPDAAIERDCRTWLLSQKRTHSWSTTKATAEACYALLLDGSDWLTTEREVTIRLGDKTASSSEKGTEAGTGYFKKVFDGPFVNPAMGNIIVTMATQPKSNSASAQPAWGAVYWQYFDNLDRITLPNAGKTPLKLKKRIFIQKSTDRGIVLEPLEENGVLHPGDKVTVRVELTSDRDLEYVHMRDMRASCMEPVNVLSSYKWQGGLGYYESTKDVSTDFFFSNLPRGAYVFEYPLFVQQTGNFSNGVTSIECMYAPEFASHSEGIRINVEPVLP